MSQINWNWKKFELSLPGFMILRIFTGDDIIEMSLKIREETGERQELIITYDLKTSQKFIASLKKISSKIEGKDFGNQVLEYNLFSSDKIQISLYFDKEDFKKLWRFLEKCNKEIQEQELLYKKLTKEGEENEK